MVVSGLAICLNEEDIFLGMRSCGRVSPARIVMDICILLLSILDIEYSHPN